MSKVAIYIRVSTRLQVDKDSLKVQRKELLSYSEIILGTKDCVVFEDAGFSAKNTERPRYQEMMSRIRSGEFTHLLVWKIDRISRNVLDFANMYEELKRLNVAFVSKNENFDTSTAIGEAMLKIILVFAELERNMTSERVSAVMMSRASEGQWNGGRVPYGYKIVDKQILINEQEKEIVLKIYRDYERLRSLVGVCSSLNKAGIKTRSGNDWSIQSIHKILKNPFYVGDYRYNVHTERKGWSKNDESEWIVVENNHPYIISRAWQQRVISILESNKKSFTHLSAKRIHLFSGYCQCGLCGSNMSVSGGSARKNGIPPSTYGCSARKSKHACTNQYIDEKIIEDFVLPCVGAVIFASTEYNLSELELNNILIKYTAARSFTSSSIRSCICAFSSINPIANYSLIPHEELPSYLGFLERLSSEKYLYSYEEKDTLRGVLQGIIANITVKNRAVSKIEFKNGMYLEPIY